MPIDLLLSGELGAGKTTFLQGLGKGLGILDDLSSPTYALEQRYQTKQFGELLHMDLYRLSEKQAKELLFQSEDHPGIRAIEWPERVTDDMYSRPLIRITLSEEGTGRLLTCSFEDMPLPTRKEIEQWRSDVLLPRHIQAHCDTVGAFAQTLAKKLLMQGVITRPLTMLRAGEVHDLLRFIDFKVINVPKELQPTAEQEHLWKELRKRYAGIQHEPACAMFLRNQSFPELGDIVEPHGLLLPAPERTTIEQKLLYYADKRVIIDNVVSLEERFDDFAKRYGNGSVTEQQKIWFEEAKNIEVALFPDGIQ